MHVQPVFHLLALFAAAALVLYRPSLPLDTGWNARLKQIGEMYVRQERVVGRGMAAWQQWGILRPCSPGNASHTRCLFLPLSHLILPLSQTADIAVNVLFTLVRLQLEGSGRGRLGWHKLTTLHSSTR